MVNNVEMSCKLPKRLVYVQFTSCLEGCFESLTLLHERRESPKFSLSLNSQQKNRIFTGYNDP